MNRTASAQEWAEKRRLQIERAKQIKEERKTAAEEGLRKPLADTNNRRNDSTMVKGTAGRELNDKGISGFQAKKQMTTATINRGGPVKAHVHVDSHRNMARELGSEKTRPVK